MSTFVFFAVPLFGHVNYGTKIAKRLERKGHRCYYFSGERYKGLVESKGLYFCAYDPRIEMMFREKDSTYQTAAMSTGEEKSIDYTEEMWKLSLHLFTIMRILSEEDLDRICRLKPDGIVYDNIAIWGRWVAEKLGIPCFSSGTPYCYNDRMFQECAEEFTALLSSGSSSIAQPLLPVLRMYNRVLHRKFPEFSAYTVTMNYAGSGDLNFLYTVPTFQLHPELIDTQKNIFTGILMDEDDFREDITPYVSKAKRNIYIALGTIYNNQSLYRKCINALRDFDANILMSIGVTNSIEDFGPLPDRWKVRNSFPQISLLPHMDVFISHGGINSLREAAHFGVPTVVFPQTGDHFLGAEDVKRTGTGCVLNNESTEQEIVQAVLSCLQTDTIQKACSALSSEMRRAGGLDKVVDVIEAAVSTSDKE